mgnify:CR=1 FL=1
MERNDKPRHGRDTSGATVATAPRLFASLGFDVGGIAPAWLTGARGFWFANTVSLMLAGAGLVLYLRRVSRAHAPASA